MKKKRSARILSVLEKEFPYAKTALRFENVFQLLVAVILSAQCTDKQVNGVTPNLFRTFPTVDAFAGASLKMIEKLIFSTGFYRNKAKHIRSAATKIQNDFHGNVPDSMKGLLSLPGVGRKTANVVLESGFGKVEGVVVDTHVVRISRLLAFISNKAEGKPEKIENELMRLLPKEKWGALGHVFINHGRKTCIARRPKCSSCPVSRFCPSKTIQAHRA